ncbi:MAG: AAA family ATPase [Paludibacteraceae bacterium]|nr:AAA family ATPase [Paludibacteraceae bacterium]
MALKSKEPRATNGLTFKTRGENDKKRIMIYGNDGTGKSTYAEKYCKEHNLKPVCIDVDDTNYTSVPLVEIDTRSDLTTFNSICQVVDLIAADERFDTIIIDGVTSLIEMLVSKANGLKKYSDRSERFTKILRKIQASGKNVIWIGQADMKVIYTEDHQSNKIVIKINSIVNEKYHCYIDNKGNYEVETEKIRRIVE